MLVWKAVFKSFPHKKADTHKIPQFLQLLLQGAPGDFLPAAGGGTTSPMPRPPSSGFCPHPSLHPWDVQPCPSQEPSGLLLLPTAPSPLGFLP